MTPYVFQRGETVAIALDCVSGDPLGVSAIAAAMKPVAAGRSTVDPGAAVAASFVVTARAASGDDPAGWTLTLSDSVSAGLSPGGYLADARLTVGGGVTITDPVAIKIVEAVTS